VDDFIIGYVQYFLDHYFVKAFDQVEKIMDENNEKKATINDTYSEQIEEMDKLLVSGRICNKNLNFRFRRKI